MVPPPEPGDTDDGPPPREQLVFFVRHAESRWNQAQASGSVMGMLWENDHGLSEAGRTQAEALRHRLRAAKCCKESSKWLEALLRPEVVYSSPFTRAIQTAVIGLRDILPDGGRLVLVREAREQKNVGGADSTGVAVGQAIAVRVEAEIRELYEAAEQVLGTSGLAGAAVEDLRSLKLDVSAVEDEWWGPLTGDSMEDLHERVQALVRRLADCVTVAGGGVVVVCHSLLIRSVFQMFLVERPSEGEPGTAASLRSQLLPFCGTVGARLRWDEHGRASITEVVPLLGTQLAPAEFDRDRPGIILPSRIASCVCGRGEPSCAIA